MLPSLSAGDSRGAERCHDLLGTGGLAWVPETGVLPRASNGLLLPGGRGPSPGRAGERPPIRHWRPRLSGVRSWGLRSEEVKEACFWDGRGREPGDGDSSGPRPETCCLKRAVHLPRSRQRDLRRPSASANRTQPQMVQGKRESWRGKKGSGAHRGPCNPPPSWGQ